LLAITRENVGRDIRALLRPAMEAVLQAIAAALQERAHQAATGLRSFNASNYEGLSMAIRSRLDEIQAQENLVLGSFVQRTRPR